MTGGEGAIAGVVGIVGWGEIALPGRAESLGVSCRVILHRVAGQCWHCLGKW